MLGLPYERLIYKDDTFGNVWDEYQPIGVDFDNNAIILDDVTGIPTEDISDNGFAYLVYKPLLNLQYGNMPTELLGVGRVKCIGDNKVQFYNGTNLVTFTDTECIDFSKCKFFKWNGTPQVRPQFSDFQIGHKYHIRLTYNAPFPGTGGIALNNKNDAPAYGQDKAHRRDGMISVTNRNTLLVSNYDGYYCTIGTRVLAHPNFMTPQILCTYGRFDIWIEPYGEQEWSKYYIESIHMSADTSKKTNWMYPKFSNGWGLRDNLIESVQIVSNSSFERFGKGSTLEIWDCGTHF